MSAGTAKHSLERADNLQLTCAVNRLMAGAVNWRWMSRFLRQFHEVIGNMPRKIGAEGGLFTINSLLSISEQFSKCSGFSLHSHSHCGQWSIAGSLLRALSGH